MINLGYQLSQMELYFYYKFGFASNSCFYGIVQNARGVENIVRIEYETN